MGELGMDPASETQRAAIPTDVSSAPHRPSERCVDTCDNPYVCQLRAQLADSQAEIQRLRAYVQRMHVSKYPHPGDLCGMDHEPGDGWTTVNPDLAMSQETEKPVPIFKGYRLCSTCGGSHWTRDHERFQEGVNDRASTGV